ncbi:MAG: ABC transporter ATP-binding protein [Candidatus Sumerlaeota bacterium]|nr:ABC transporter ATP-binding protein [Candidatus Sumerlaeota bacterium]
MDQSQFPPLQHPVRTYFRFARHVLPYWDKLLFCMLGIAVMAPITQIELLLTRAVVDQAVINDTNPIETRLFMMALFVGLAATCLWLNQLLEHLCAFFDYYVQTFVTLDLRRLFYRCLHRLPYQFFQSRPIGEHMYRCLADISPDLSPFSRGVINMVVSNPIEMLRIANNIIWQGMLVMVLNPMTALLIAITVPVYAVAGYWMNTRIKHAFLRLKKEDQAVPAVLRDAVAGIETVTAYGRRRRMTARYVGQFFRAVRAGLLRDYLTVLYLQGVFWALDLIAIGGMWTFLIYQLMIGQISVGSFTVLLHLSTRFIDPFKRLVDLLLNIRQQLVPAQRILETLDIEPALEDRPHALPMPRVAGRIRFENVSFSYDPAAPVLRNVSFEIEPGSTLGIVGRSGAGKTTMLNLLLRLYRPDSGRILVDNHDIDTVRLADWQDQVGTVMQNTFIFGGDVAYNVRYGRMDTPEDEIWKVLRMAEADEFVAAMPDSLHTDLAEGSKLSGGQKQRLGIARALVRWPRVLILDEPTSALDSRAENEIWRSFEKAMAGATTVIISHRLTTVRKADHIVVLEKGEIVEQGTHDGLVRAGGLYARMWHDQAGGGGE